MISSVKKLKYAALALIALLALTAEASKTNQWMTTAANTPLTAYLWTDGANWKDVRTGLVGTVPADLDCLQFTRGNNAYFVKLPEEVLVGPCSAVAPGNYNTNVFLIGEKWIHGGTVRPSCYCGWIFADFYTRREGFPEDPDPWLGSNCQIAGRLIVPYEGDALKGRVVPASGTVYLRMDCFATSPNPLRTDDLQLFSGNMVPGDANVQFMVAGADASASDWLLTPGSPYIQAVGDFAPVAVGAAVTGAGIPAGTWVRRRFGNTGWLELSQNVNAEAAGAATLAFAAFHPDVRLGVASYSTQGSIEALIVLTREHAEDKLTLEVTNLNCSAAVNMRWGFGAPSSNPDAGLLPGKLVLRKVTSSRNQPITITHRFYNSHVELAGSVDGGDTTFNERCLVSFGDTGSVARITVPAGRTGEIMVLTNFNGTLVKDGPGTLRIGLADASGQGGITVEEGTLELTVRESAGTAPIVFGGALTMTGGTLAIPAQGLTFAAAALTADAVIRGPGIVEVVSARGEGAAPRLENGAQIRYNGNAAAGSYVHAPEAAVAGHPAFWVDASKRDSFVLENEGGIDYVRRWNDWRDGETMFATNITRRPVLHWGEEMTNKYVKITRVQTQNGAESEGLVWSVPIDHIRAVFMVHDPVDGGGCILGRTSRLPDNYYGSQGGPFYHSNGGMIVAERYATDRVKYGRFFRDGSEFCAYQTTFEKKPEVLEFHVNTAFWARPGVKEELVCDAFGTGTYRSPHEYKDDDGRQRLSEVLIYTNSLTHAERVQTALYLSRKWLGKDIVYSDIDESLYAAAAAFGEGEGIRVKDGMTVGVRLLEGGGPLVKDGGGTLVVESLKAGDVRVDGGELVVKSMSIANDSFPGDPWTHMDAQDADSVTMDGDGKVSQWTSVGGDGQSYKPVDTVLPVYGIDAATGHPMIDCGVFDNATASAALRLYQADDTAYIHADAYSGYVSSPYIRAAFIVCSSAAGGGSLLGAWSQGFPWQGVPHDGSTNAITSVKTGTYYPWGAEGTSLSLTNGNYSVRCNSVEVNALDTPFSGGTDIFTFGRNFQRKSDTLACFGQKIAAKGGLAYGEVLLYTNKLDDALLPKIEAVLREKWFGEGTDGVGARRAVCDSLFVATGAKVTVANWAFMNGVDEYAFGEGAITTGALGGGGQVEGNVKVTEGGELLVEAANGVLPTLVVTGALSLPQALAVRVSGDLASLAPGVYTLVENAGIREGDVVDWHVEAPARPHRVVRPYVENGAIKAAVFARGTMFIFR